MHHVQGSALDMDSLKNKKVKQIIESEFINDPRCNV